jgi:acetyl-CoA decarbonylase/synthase complex subunit gamma
VGNDRSLSPREDVLSPPACSCACDTEPAEALTGQASTADAYSVDYVGINLGLDGFAVEAASGDPAKFAAAIGSVRSASKKPLILIASTPEAMQAGLAACGGTRPLLHAATAENATAMADLARQANAPLVARADTLDGLADLTQKLAAAGVEDLVLDPMVSGYRTTLHTLTHLRRLALRKSFRPLGYPIITFPGAAGGEDLADADVAKSPG